MERRRSDAFFAKTLYAPTPSDYNLAGVSPDTEPSVVGKTLGHYEVLEPLGMTDNPAAQQDRPLDRHVLHIGLADDSVDGPGGAHQDGRAAAIHHGLEQRPDQTQDKCQAKDQAK